MAEDFLAQTTRASTAGNGSTGQKAVSSLTTPHTREHLKALSFPTTQLDVKICTCRVQKHETVPNKYFIYQEFEDLVQVDNLEFNYDMHALNAYDK